MTAYRFRVKFDPDPTSLWRDIVVGENRTVEEFQTAINRAVGLDHGHLWFVGTDEDYWNSEVKYECTEAFGETPNLGGFGFDEETYDASETTIGEMVRQLELEERDRLCYLYDYGDEWRFYAICTEIVGDESSDREPEVRKRKGDPIDQYGASNPRET
ncbi:IS1096 element passenger TnpR family protein [Halorussus caseinilyticus]|uniref:Plasmid pRiA4b Orf3-like domain-containing protein n=2 Tax=Halorussus caseinilyticus TaxID=3034025 RepID=A0ABD5WGR2_9EURY